MENAPTVYTCPENVELVPGYKPHVIHNEGNRTLLGWVALSDQEAAHILDKQRRARMRDT